MLEVWDRAVGWLLFLEVKVVSLWEVHTGEQGHLAKIQLSLEVELGWELVKASRRAPFQSSALPKLLNVDVNFLLGLA